MSSPPDDGLASDERTEIDAAAPKHQSASSRPTPPDSDIGSDLSDEVEAKPGEPQLTKRERRSRRSRRHPDIETARLLVRRGLVLKKDAVEALRQQKARVRAGKERVPYLRLLVKRGALSPENLDDARDEIRRNTYICDSCYAQAVVLAGSQTRAGACPRCGNEIAVEAPSNPELVPAREFSGSQTEAWLPMTDEPAQRVFGRYQLLEELGRGAMGVVYRARHTQLGKDVALKLLLPSEEAWDMQVARFRREAAAVQKLRHPGIIAVHDFGFEGKAYYLTMDLVENGTPFHTLLKDPALAPPLARRIELLIKVCLAVGHAHSRSVIHRDLKPANVLLTEEGEPLVVDFGLAKDEEEGAELTRTHDRLGTPLFMAPEQIRKGAAAVDYRVDIWALGVMLFVCATGRYPFRSRTVMDLYLRVMRESPDWAGNLYSAPDRAGILVPERKESELKQDPYAETAADLLASDEATEVSTRGGPGGELPKVLPPPGVSRKPVGQGQPSPPPFVAPPDLVDKEIPRDLRAIIECALNKDPDDRYVTCEDLAFDLQRFLESKPILHARRPTVWRRLRLALRRRKVLMPMAWGLVALAIGLGALVGFQVWARGTEERRAQLELALAGNRDWSYYGQLDETLTSLSAEYGPDAELLYHRATARLRRFNLDEAQADLDAAGAADPEPPLREAIARERALIEIMRGNYEAAVRSGRAALEAQQPPSFEGVHCFAQSLFAAPDPDPALLKELEGWTTELVEREGTPAAIVALHVRLPLERGELDVAEARLPERGKQDPFELLLVRGALALAQGKVEEAEQDFRYARSAWRPKKESGYGQLTGDLQYFDWRGFQFKRRGEFELSLLANKAAAALSPFHSRPHYWIGRLVLTRLADTDQALPHLRLASKLDPYDDEVADLLYATLTARRGRLDEALDYLEGEVVRRPHDPAPLLQQAYQRLRRGETEAARAAIEAAAKACEGSEPRTRLAKAALIRLEGGDDAGLTEEGYNCDYRTPLDPSESTARYKRVVERRVLRDYVEVGRIYLEHDRPDDALVWLPKVTAEEAALSANQDATIRHVFASACVLEARARLRKRWRLPEDQVANEALAFELLAKATWKQTERDDQLRRDPLSPWLALDVLESYPELQNHSERPELQAVLNELRGK